MYNWCVSAFRYTRDYQSSAAYAVFISHTSMWNFFAQYFFKVELLWSHNGWRARQIVIRLAPLHSSAYALDRDVPYTSVSILNWRILIYVYSSTVREWDTLIRTQTDTRMIHTSGNEYYSVCGSCFYRSKYVSRPKPRVCFYFEYEYPKCPTPTHRRLPERVARFPNTNAESAGLMWRILGCGRVLSDK